MPEAFDPQEVARFERVVWSRCAEGYVDGFGALMRETIAPLLDAADVTRGSRVLDVGTGPGLAAAAAVQREAEATGIDFSDEMVDVARRRFSGIDFRVASADALPFDAGVFDAVVYNFVIHHLGQPETALAEAFRVLGKGGRVAFTVWGDPSQLEAFGLFFAAVEEHGSPSELPHGPLFGVSDFGVFHDMVRRAGFHDSSVKQLAIAWRMSSIDPLLAAFRRWASLDAFPTNVQSAIEASVRRNATRYESGDGLVIPNPAILVSARK